MRYAIIAVVLIIFSSVALAQNETTNQSSSQPPPDLCANVRCESPPPSYCPDAKAFVRYISPGTCDSATGTCNYRSERTECASLTKTCADGFVAACQQLCDSAACKPCTPDCTGHEISQINQTTTPVCPQLPAKPVCEQGFYLNTIYSNGCITGYECKASTTAVCKETDAGFDIYAKGVIYPPGIDYSKEDVCVNEKSLAEYSCNPDGTYAGDRQVDCPSGCRDGACIRETMACPQLTPPGPDYCRNGRTEPRYDKNNCVIGYDCISTGNIPVSAYNVTPPSATVCPAIYAPVCGKDGRTYPNDCGARAAGTEVAHQGECPRPAYCGNGICEKGEESFCQSDCINARTACPVTQDCPDGSTVSCKQTDMGCFCETCPLPATSLPQGCRQEVDKEKGFVNVVCGDARQCPRLPADMDDMKNKCEREGGIFNLRKDPNGCEFPDCMFQETRTNPFQKSTCRSETDEQIENTKRGCEKLGLHLAVAFEGNCRISRCSQQVENVCPDITLEVKKNVEDECRSRGLNIIKDFQNGCPVLRCGEPDFCQRDVPKDAYEKCGSGNGELIMKRDNNGCVVFSQCVTRGDVRQSYSNVVEEVPDSAELLSIAFRMEELKIELEKLAKKTADIADYYKSANSQDEERFRRVSNMFLSARDKTNEIKTKLKDRLEDITKDDVYEIKNDIRYIKDVMMKDILYLMLSTSDEVRQIGTKEEEDCGSRGECFDRAFRLCRKVTFRPEGRNGPIINVAGLEGDACVMNAEMPEGEGPPAGVIPGGPPWKMTCKVKNYALGVKGPEDILPYCEGSMVELVKRFGTGGPEEGGPGVPGKCSGDECREYCGRGPEEAKECLQYLGPYLPAEARQSLESLARGRSSGFREPLNPQQPSSAAQLPLQPI